MKRKPHHPGTRLGTKKAQALLAEVAQQHQVDVKSMKERANHQHLVLARRDYCVLGLELGITATVLAVVLDRDHGTVVYHQRPEYRARKNSEQRQKYRSHVARETHEAGF